MKFFGILLFVLTIPSYGVHAQHAAQKQTGATDQLGMSCAQILQMSSTDWVVHFHEKASQAKDANPGAQNHESEAGRPSAETADPQLTLRAIETYGKCYDARTDRLAASLGQSGKGPLMGVRGNFRDFEAALKSFTAIALNVTQPPDDPVKTAYAALYEKQFRYAFYQSYQQKPVKEPAPAVKDVKPAVAGAEATAPATTSQPASAAHITDPMTLAKNRFGDFLEALPEDKRRQVHIAFGEIFEKGAIADLWKLEVYRYAISILESPKDKPFSPPPF
jgi:hypothetical protein